MIAIGTHRSQGCASRGNGTSVTFRLETTETSRDAKAAGGHRESGSSIRGVSGAECVDISHSRGRTDRLCKPECSITRFVADLEEDATMEETS